jgi:hypothetical protein
MRVNAAAPLYFNRFYTGLITQRNRLAIPIRVFGRRIIELYDALIDGLNMELNSFLTLQRAPGYIQYNSNTLAGIQQNYYSFKPTGLKQCLPIFDTTTAVFQMQPGAVAPTTLITKTQPIQSTFKAIGGYLYVGAPQFIAQKVDASLNVTNMGIAISPAADSVGPNTAGTGANAGGGGTAWTNPNNINSNVSFATATFSYGPGHFASVSQLLNAQTFAFAIPGTNTISGIQVFLQAKYLLNSGSHGTNTVTVTLLKNGNPTGISKQTTITDPLATYPFGGPGDTWGTTFTPSDVNNAAWGFAVSVSTLLIGTTGNGTFSVNFGQATIFGVGGPTVTPTGVGSLSAQNGWIYAYSYGNSQSENESNLTPPSSSTGPFTGKSFVGVGVLASPDAQVNQIHVYRTTDGGPANLFFELPNSPFPNANATIQDTAIDSGLQVSSVQQYPSINFPPPAGASGFEWYGGRLWAFVGNLLYFSSGSDILKGNEPECWNPDYVFELPVDIVRLVPLGSAGMFVVTLDEIHLVQGTSTQSFSVTPWAAGIGARSYNAVDADGSNVYIFTTDRQLLLISPAGVAEPGDNIGDLLDTLDPTLAYVRVHRSGSQDQNLFVSDGATTLYTLNLKQQAWCPKRQPVGGVNAIESIEITPGVWKFMLGSPNAGRVVLQRDLATFSDNGTTYPCSCTFGNIQFADPGMLANVESLVTELSNVTTKPSVGILVNDISGSFAPLSQPRTEPTTISYSAPQGSYVSLLWYLKTADKNKASTAMRHMQFKLAWPAETNKEEILGIGLMGPPDTSGAPAPQPAIQGR